MESSRWGHQEVQQHSLVSVGSRAVLRIKPVFRAMPLDRHRRRSGALVAEIGSSPRLAAVSVSVISRLLLTKNRPLYWIKYQVGPA